MMNQWAAIVCLVLTGFIGYWTALWLFDLWRWWRRK